VWELVGRWKGNKLRLEKWKDNGVISWIVFMDEMRKTIGNNVHLKGLFEERMIVNSR
jgi:hypothetical protein